MAKGRIAGLRAEAGFGFIDPDDGGEELFFHYTDLRGVDIHDLKPRARVEFTPTPGRGKGPRAADVSVVGPDTGSCTHLMMLVGSLSAIYSETASHTSLRRPVSPLARLWYVLPADYRATRSSPERRQRPHHQMCA